MNGDVIRSVIPEQVLPGKRLGRHIVHDPRSRDYPAENAPTITSVVHNAVGLPRGLADQIDAPNKLVWFWNSWGTTYGVGGRFCMSFDTWQQLLDETGDVTVPTP